MTSFSKIAAGLLFGLVVASAVPASAASRHVQGGLNARAQAVEQSIGDEGGVSPDRARALRDCNEKAAGFRDYTWGVREIEIYRSCMADRGQVE